MDTTTKQPTQERVREELAQWREAKKNGVWKMLVGTGLPVRMRRLSLLQMVKAGVLPAALKPKADKVWNAEGLKLDDLAGLEDLVDEQLMQAIIEPRPVRRAAESDDDYVIGMDEISPDEKLVLFNWLNAPPARLTDFLVGAGS